MSRASEAVVNQVISLIEPLTRFDRSSVSLEGESEHVLSCTGTWTSTIVYSSSTSDGNGSLPSGLHNAGSQAGMDREIGALLAEEREKAATRIQKWCAGQGTVANHKPLTVPACFSGPVRLGYEWLCPACKGAGKVTCSNCFGGRQVTCTQCNGHGKTKCYQCGGDGQRTCSHCGGRQGIYLQHEKRVYNDATNQYSVTYENQWQACMQCQGGKVRCHACHDGYNHCFTCGTLGKVDCRVCLASGSEKCKGCDGEAKLHRVAQTTCEVSNTFTVRVRGAGEAVQRTAALWDFASFIKLAKVSAEDPVINGGQLKRVYPATLQLTQVRIRCAGDEFQLLGYGEQAQVFDFQGIAGRLLAKDLEQLQSALRLPDQLLALSHREELRRALVRTLQSELNQKLCDPSQREPFTANGTVTGTQAEETVRTMSKSVGLLYRVFAVCGLLGVVAAVLVTLQFLYSFHYMIPRNRPLAIAIFVGSSLAAGFGAEFLARHLFLSEFSGSGEESVIAAGRLLRLTGALKRWRIATGAFAAVAVACFFAIVNS